MEHNDEKIAELEALLFIHGEPIPLKKIAGRRDSAEDDVRALVAAYTERLAAADRGLGLVTLNDRVQLATKPQFSKILEAFVKAELSEELSPASLETLAVIAYFGPIPRARIDYQRGVNSTFILRSLLLRGLVERYPDPVHPNSFVYTPSFEALKWMGVGKQAELPDYDKFRTLLERFERQDAPAAPVAETLLQDAVVVPPADAPSLPPPEPTPGS